MKCIRHNLWQLLIAVDQLFNVLASLPCEKVYADETLSSRAWRWHVAGVRSWPKNVIDTLFFWQDGHCQQSYESERAYKHLPPELRG